VFADQLISYYSKDTYTVTREMLGGDVFSEVRLRVEVRIQSQSAETQGTEDSIRDTLPSNGNSAAFL
jgi:hypothetical protein